MTDPRYTDPRYSDPRPDAGLPQGDGLGGLLGWIVGIAAVILIAFVVSVGIKHGTNTASDKPLATSESAPNSVIGPPSTTGFGGSSPQPMTPPTRSEEPLPPLPKRGG
jgi:hypothetical protein